jgi:2-polyprenyl-6-methoxyphenol hydroxylase-like FAD-dependent oxidoreductase
MESHGDPSNLELHLDRLGDHIFWAFVAQREKYAVDFDEAGVRGPVLQAAVRGMMNGWHPQLIRLVADSDADSVRAFRIQSSAPIEPWATTRVTLLGDAIHAMTPLQGLGGNMALRDAQELVDCLADVHLDRAELLPTLRRYETKMLRRGFEAVRLSRTIGDLAVSDSILPRAAFRAVLRFADGVPALKRRMFRAPLMAEPRLS